MARYVGTLYHFDAKLPALLVGVKEQYWDKRPVDGMYGTFYFWPERRPVVDQRCWWWYRDELWVTDEADLSEADVAALLNEKENKKRLALQRAHALQAMTERLSTPGKRQKIPSEVQLAVWRRDTGQCVSCGSNENLEFDHIIPHSMGGSDTERNLQLLCATCNRRKGATLGGEDLAGSQRRPRTPTGAVRPTTLTDQVASAAMAEVGQRRCPHCATMNRVPIGAARARCGRCGGEFAFAVQFRPEAHRSS